jgi:1,2-dihydroxy-3-keto-5-methylthiopentene dioxygenase
MALVRIPEQQRTIEDAASIAAFLAQHRIMYERYSEGSIPADATPETVLRTYATKIDELKARGGYVTADVIDVTAATPGLDTMLAKFSRDHWHDEDEVRIIVEGRGIYHVSPPSGPVFAIEVEGGDLISLPRGTHHWFDLCAERRIRAIRLFQDPGGWTPHYTESGLDAAFQPVCFGPAYFSREGYPILA